MIKCYLSGTEMPLPAGEAFLLRCVFSKENVNFARYYLKRP